MGAYAYLCGECRHLLSQHGLVPDAPDVVTGPYRCEHCPCEVRQDVDAIPLTRRQYNDWREATP